MTKHFLAVLSVLLVYTACPAQENTMCSNTAARSWWDVREYELQLTFDTATNFITGSNTITALVTGQPLQALQLELHEPLHIDSVQLAGHHLGISRQGDVYFITGDLNTLKQQDSFALKVYYSGIPVIAKRAPWDGGMVHSRDAAGLPWLAVACQGSGAYLWFPCKNFEGDEPERAVMHYTVPANLSAIGNGRLIRTETTADKQHKTFTWAVQNPVNNYDITFYIGDYVHWSDTFAGAKGKLSLDYYVLRANEEKARKQFAVVQPMLACFEAKMGPYPFYEDGYKLVDAPYLGMEHQSALAYGNEYKMGYLGRDRSKTGVGLTFDFIIIHESGHEWFGNNITAYDVADTWIHEGFTSYSETIFAECLQGKEASFRYQQGKRQLIRNDIAVQGKYDACDEGSGDHYDKGAFTVHMIRMIMNDDERFFAMLRAMNKKFYHQLVKSVDIENFMSTYAGKDFSKLFDQYLRHTEIPLLEWQITGGSVHYRWSNCVEGFDMPVLIAAADKKETWIYPTTAWKKTKVNRPVKVNPNFLVDLK